MNDYRKEIDRHLFEFFKYFSHEEIRNENISIETYIKIKARYSGKRICELLKVNESTLLNFEKAIRNYFKHQNNDELDYISQIRLMYFLEPIFKNIQISFDIKLRQNSSSEELTLKKVRALELVIRDVITAHNGGKESLIKTLNEFFKSEIVQQWLKNADETGVLSGTTFSELSALFLHSRLFPKYDALFIQDKGLNYEKSKTDSLMYFLNDIRIIRNTLAHNKKVSEIQIELVNQYYKEIIGRIEMAFSTGMTKVNPVIHLNPSSSDINVFKSSLKEEIDDVKTKILVLDDSLKKTARRVLLNQKFLIIAFILIVFTIISVVFLRKEIGFVKTDVELTISNIINNYSKPIGNPKTPNEFLINAVLYKKSGDTQQSLINFQKYFEADLLFIEPHLEYHELLNLINDNNAKLDYVNLLEENGNVFFDFVKILFTNSEKALLDELERFNSINPDFELSELFLIKYMIEQDRSTIARNPNSFDICKAIEKYRNAGDRLSTILLNAEFTNYFLDKSQAQNFITSEEKNFINSTANHLNSVAEGILMHGQIPESQLVSVIKNMGFRNCSDEVIQSAIKHVKFADVIDQTEKLNYDKSIKGRFDLTYQDVLVPDEYLIILPEKIYIKSRVVNQYIEMKYYFSGSKLIASGELINMEFKVIDDHTLIYYEDSNEYIYKKTSNVDESSFIDELTQPEDGKYILFLDNTEYGDEMSLVIKNHQVTFFTKQHPNGVSAYYSKSNDAIYFNLGGNEFAFDIIDEYNLVEFSFIKKPEELLKFRKLEKKNP